MSFNSPGAKKNWLSEISVRKKLFTRVNIINFETRVGKKRSIANFHDRFHFLRVEVFLKPIFYTASH